MVFQTDGLLDKEMRNQCPLPPWPHSLFWGLQTHHITGRGMLKLRLDSEVCCRPSSGYQPRCVLGLKTMCMDSLLKWWGPPISELILHQFTCSETSPPCCPWPVCSVGCRVRLLFGNPPAMQAQESLAQRSLGTAQVCKQGSSPGHAIPTFPQDNGDRACTRRAGRALVLVVAAGSSIKFNLQENRGCLTWRCFPFFWMQPFIW